jgi:hypothetical protein
MRGLWAVLFPAVLTLMLNAQSSWAQQAMVDSSGTSSADSGRVDSSDSTGTASAERTRPEPVDVTNEVLACAVGEAHSAGFTTQLSLSGRVLHAWRPHLESIDANETDYVRVRVYGRGSAKGFRWEVEAHTITGRAMITTSVYSPRPPSREAYGLRRSIEKTCAPKQDRSSTE